MPRAAKRARTSRGKPKRPALSSYESARFRRSAQRRHGELVAELQRTYKPSGIALYLGAGVSASAGFPA
jgi:hypothetical protein